jgi:rfaE bifunctional protein nucleotidyltransferase chain/domain
MDYRVLTVSEKEHSIIKNNNEGSTTQANPKVDYRSCVCIKPWGYEFLVYESERIGIWFLNIKRGHGTSLHTHFKKDTFVIVLSGTAKLVLIDNEVVALNTMSSVFVPKNKFHAFSSFSDEVFLLEIEIFDRTMNFSDKNDLLRIDDQYNRKKTGYESSVNLVHDNLEEYNHFTLFENTTKNIFGTTISVTNDIKSLVTCSSNYNILLDRCIYADGRYLNEGSIVKCDDFKGAPIIENPTRFLTVQNNYSKEDSKIIYSAEHLKSLLPGIRSGNKKIVMTCGCYDILHVGHLHNLKVSKSLGDTLIVCMSNDEQIKALKGDTRPINKYADRIDIFKTLPYVDYIILYDETDIEKEAMLGQLMKLVSPDIWTKGDDYTVERIVDKHPYLNKIVLIDNVKGRSTTNIIHKIMNVHNTA